MKQVMQQYGAVIMAIIMFVGIMAAFYGVSIGNRQGMYLPPCFYTTSNLHQNNIKRNYSVPSWLPSNK